MHSPQRRNLLISIVLSLAALATSATAATAQSERGSTVPACEELLTVQEAKAAMGEPKAFIVTRSVIGSTRHCIYAAGSPTAVTHSLGVEWGPYSDARKHAASFESELCSKVKKKAACEALGTAAKLRPDLKSFAALEKALSQFGVTMRLPSIGYEPAPAFVWKPSGALAPIDQLAFVYAYDVRSAHLLQAYCTDNASRTADTTCAIAAAHRAYTSIT